MATIFELVIKDSGSSDVPLSPDPLYEDDALVEATLLSVLCTPLNDSIALLFDLRTSLFFDQGNTGILVARKVSELSISNSPYRAQQYHVWVSGKSKITLSDDFCSINLDNRIHIKSHSADFFTGIVDGIGEVAESLDDGLDVYLKTIPDWNSAFVITGFSHLSIALP